MVSKARTKAKSREILGESYEAKLFDQYRAAVVAQTLDEDILNETSKTFNIETLSLFTSEAGENFFLLTFVVDGKKKVITGRKECLDNALGCGV